MNVCIVEQGLRKEARFQIMINRNDTFYHVYPGKLYTMEAAKEICKNNGYNIIAIGDIWHCVK